MTEEYRFYRQHELREQHAQEPYNEQQMNAADQHLLFLNKMSLIVSRTLKHRLHHDKKCDMRQFSLIIFTITTTETA